MGDIYKPASVVLVWLGPADGSTLLAFSLVHDITTQAPKLQKIKETSEYAETRAIDHAIQYPSFGGPVWLAIRSLFNRPWFSRVWTFQEIVLARKVMIHCGVHTMRWQRLEMFVMCLDRFSAGTYVQDSRLKGEDENVKQILMLRRLGLSPGIENP